MYSVDELIRHVIFFVTDPIIITLALSGFLLYVYNTIPPRMELGELKHLESSFDDESFLTVYTPIGKVNSLEDLERIQKRHPDIEYCTLPEDGTGIGIVKKVEHRESGDITSYCCFPIKDEGFFMPIPEVEYLYEVKTDPQLETDCKVIS